MKKFKNLKGVTLIELLVVVAIIGILSAAGVLLYNGYTEMTKMRVLVANYKTIIKVIKLELAAANNGLQSNIKEYDQNGNVVADKMDENTTCNNFAFSVQAHFSDFKNPFNQEWESVTVDTLAQSKHRQGHIQVVCYSHFGSFGNGGGCPISSDGCRLLVIAYKKDKGRWNTSDGKCDNTISTSNHNARNWDNDCFLQKLVGADKQATEAAQKDACRWDPRNHGSWIVTQNRIRAAAGGPCC
jgi:prepilin-type N-terminal cleavage/methylation domain-containing protein